MLVIKGLVSDEILLAQGAMIFLGKRHNGHFNQVRYCNAKLHQDHFELWQWREGTGIEGKPSPKHQTPRKI